MFSVIQIKVNNEYDLMMNVVTKEEHYINKYLHASQTQYMEKYIFNFKKVDVQLPFEHR